MDYLDELDDCAMLAFAELTGEVKSYTQPVVSVIPTHKAPLRHRCSIEAIYLLRLEHPLTSPQDVARVLNLPQVPQLESGMGEDGEASFCRLSKTGLDVLSTWAAKHYPKWRYTKIHLNLAHKDDSQLAMLGCDATLPQYRPSSITDAVSERFPVQYFFYGTLAEPVRLARLLNLLVDSVPRLKPAICRDGKVSIWNGKYKALVDAPGEFVEGYVLEVGNEEQENALRLYETDAYEVVHARCMVGDVEVVVRTFRFCGNKGELL